ncbi:MAG TPA: iron-sulfur cluster assembly scaffold protein [Terriglobia bacterium]|nr:iron-sulfur cluster assembly scaffold protein [Terriglobia bacterium]
MAYSDKVLDHFHHPRNAGEIAEATATAEASNPVCGDVMKLSARVNEGRIIEAKFKAQGCIPAIACGSWLAEWMEGKRLSEIGGLTAPQIDSALGGLPAASGHASVLAVDALKKLLRGLSF